MLALQWSDINFENSTVSVTKAAAVVDGKQVCKAPKTKNSRREVSIPRFLTDRLHNLMIEQTKTKESLGAYWKGNNWLFTQSDGSMMSCGSLLPALMMKLCCPGPKFSAALHSLSARTNSSHSRKRQFWKRVHETGRIYDADLEDLRQTHERLWDAARDILSALSKLK